MRQQVSGQLLARIGTTVQQKYRIQRLIGVGGMAAVYAATHRNGHRVALKFLLEAGSNDPDIRHLFSREAYVANQVGHPGAVPVIDDDVDEEGCPFLIMPLLQGETLRARWERASKRLPIAEIGVLMSDVLDVLASAHAKGIVHRDIKPDNLFVTRQGEVRVLDFGIARRTQVDGRATVTGRMFGTPAFMPPEQALGDRAAIGPHSDCWAVGATIFTLLSGEFVHQAVSGNALLVAAATKPARSLREVSPTLPASFIHFVDKALAVQPDARWPSANEMREALRQASEAALGEQFATVRMRVRDTLISEAAPRFDNPDAEATQRPTRSNSVAPHEVHDTPRVERSANIHIDQIPPTLHAIESRVASTRIEQGQSRSRAILRAGGIATFAVALLLAFTFGKRNLSRIDDDRFMTPESRQNIDARNAVEEGLLLWRDASIQGARNKFGEAARLDPSLASAHLYFAAASEEITDPSRLSAVHSHLVNAQSLRERLTAPQQALLDAMMPLADDSPDYVAVTNGLERMTASFPDYEVGWSVRAAIDLRRKESTNIDAYLPHISGALEFLFRAGSELQRNDIEAARSSLRTCTKRSSRAQECLIWLAQLEANEGGCDDSMRAARALIRLNDALPEAYRYLAYSEFGRSRRTDAVRAILREKWARTPEGTRAIEEKRDEFFLAILDGHFDAAYRALDEWGAAAPKAADSLVREYLYIARVDLDLELGRTTEAARTARQFADAASAWRGNQYVDLSIEVTRALYLTGEMPRADFLRQREHDEAGLVSRGGYFEAPAVRWYEAYVQTIADADDAHMAIQRRPPAQEQVANAVDRDAHVDEELGHMYLVAGNIDAAIPPLRRATRSCSYWVPLQRIRAHALYAEALSQRVPREACREYQFVLDRWGSEPRSRTALAAREGARRLKCH